MNNNHRNKLKESILNYLYTIDGVISVTLVGSFMKNAKYNNFSDIDIVIIAKKLNLKILNDAKKIKTKINLKDINLLDHKVKTNFTFGPLKFFSNKTIVLHIMMYDIDSHIDHVIQSPFTCYDWERSKIFKGKSISEICSVRKIQLSDFVKSRRGINDYYKDLKNSRLSYREYSFKQNKILLNKKYILLDDIHKIEFSYHIIKNLINNLGKFLNQNNKILSENNFKTLFNTMCDNNKNLWIFYTNLKKIKLKKQVNLKKNLNLFINIKLFLIFFKKYINFINQNKSNIYIYRHAKTTLNLNKDLFIGQKLNPTIIKRKLKFHKRDYNKVFSSKLLRCIQTAKLLSNNKVHTYSLLNEINYGDVEGKNLSYLKENHNYLLSGWSNGLDMRFPNGENYSDLVKRLNSFTEILLKSVKPKENYLIVTHNVILRVLIGNYFGLDMKNWYILKIKNLASFKFISFNNKIYPEINRRLFIYKIYG